MYTYFKDALHTVVLKKAIPDTTQHRLITGIHDFSSDNFQTRILAVRYLFLSVFDWASAAQQT